MVRCLHGGSPFKVSQPDSFRIRLDRRSTFNYSRDILKKPEALGLPNVENIYSVGSCVNDDFADYIQYWKHNGHWLFDSPETIQAVAKENSIDLQGMILFYYETHEMQFAENGWESFSSESSILTHVIPPEQKRLEGFDVVTFWAGNAPECSPLSCNGLAEEIRTNAHCLFDTFDEAETSLNSGKFNGAEPGPYRIFAVYSVNWP
jgi:hypothetical protein